MNYYNEWDSAAAGWLEVLMDRGLIPKGHIDTRSIVDVTAADLAGYTQHHFFCGVAGWPLALDLAGWPRTRPVWSGSCPCQDYSVAGKRAGAHGERDLWPAWASLIRECRPECLFGEQVEAAIRHGWLDRVRADMEGEGYAVGGVVLGAHSAGAPHIRQRLFWVADSGSAAREWNAGSILGAQAAVGSEGQQHGDFHDGHRDGGAASGGDGWLRHPLDAGLEGYSGDGADGDQPGRHGENAGGPTAPPVRAGGVSQPESEQVGDAGLARERADTFWSDYDILPFLDGKARRSKSGLFPLANGVPARVVRLRGYGNAIVPQCAQAFIAAYMEVEAAA